MSQRRKNHLRTNGRALDYSKLEPKHLLATISLVQGELRIVGTPGDDAVDVDVFEADPGTTFENNVSVRDGSQELFFSKADIDSIQFFGLAGNDSFRYSGFGSADPSTIDLIGFYGGDGNDQFFVWEEFGVVDEVIGIGGAGDDVLETQALHPLESSVPVRFFGNDGNDRLIGSVLDDTLVGGAGEDTLYGIQGNDRLFGGEDDDDLNGGFGDDVLHGGNGADFLHGGDPGAVTPDSNELASGGDDLLFGGQGNDMLDGSDGADRLFGGVGNDSSFGGPGDDIINSGDGDDDLFGGPGNDRLVGGIGDDLLNGSFGNDTLLGLDGNDRLFGISGFNHLFGGNGDDTLLGGAEFDVVFGQAGNDWLGNALEDTTDFTDGEDSTDFLLEDFLGLSLDDASSLADSLERQSRVVFLDGLRQATTADIVPSRLNFSVEFDEIIAVWTDTGKFAGDFRSE